MPRSALCAPIFLALTLLNCGSSPHEVTEKYYLVSTNTKLRYWQQALAGLNHISSDLKVKTEMLGPDGFDPKAEHEQFREILGRKPTGILLSAGDPNILKDDIDAAISQGVPVITMDADAPASKRLLFIGTDNYKAGAMGARVVASRLQGKGNVAVYTTPEQANLKDRLRGYNDVFADHPGIKITEVVDTRGDPRVTFDRTMEMMEKKAKIDAFVCLTSSAGPEVADVLKRHNATGKVVVAMDTDPRTLEGIQTGTISATIGQKPFTMAYFGVKILDDLHHHPLKTLTGNWPQDSFSPLPAFIDTGATLIDKSNVDGFIQGLKSAEAQ